MEAQNLYQKLQTLVDLTDYGIAIFNMINDIRVLSQS
jgi:hypothetical protein